MCEVAGGTRRNAPTLTALPLGWQTSWLWATGGDLRQVVQPPNPQNRLCTPWKTQKRSRPCLGYVAQGWRVVMRRDAAVRVPGRLRCCGEPEVALFESSQASGSGRVTSSPV